MIEDLVVEEEALSKEVVEISDWAETLENFLQRKMKPIETRDQLRDVISEHFLLASFQYSLFITECVLLLTRPSPAL